MNRTLACCRITIDGQPDAGSVRTLVRDIVAALPADATTEQRVLALYRYVRTHLFAYLGTMDDAIEPLNQAVRTLNWWGFGLCGRQAKTLGILAGQLLGYENVRLLGMREREVGAWRVGEDGRPWAFHWTTASTELTPGQRFGHSSLEIRWDGSWHLLDVMVGFYRRDESGRIVSAQEIADRPQLADRPVGDVEGDMPYGPEPEIFTRSELTVHGPGLNAWAGELAPLNLRPGESFTFMDRALPGEFFVHPRMRTRFTAESVEGGPREGRRNAPPAAYANAEHRFDVRLTPDDECPFWQPASGDWIVPVELPYPVTSIHWQMSPRDGCDGFLSFAPSTADALTRIESAGSHRPPVDALVGTGYRVIVRSPGRRRQPIDLKLRTICQHNPLVMPQLAAGRNVVRISGDGGGCLHALLAAECDGEQMEFRLQDAGPHEVNLPEAATITGRQITLSNPS